MRASYLRRREVLEAEVGETVEVTALGGARAFVGVGLSVDDFVALARDAYVRGDLTVEEFESEIERAERTG